MSLLVIICSFHNFINFILFGFNTYVSIFLVSVSVKHGLFGVIVQEDIWTFEIVTVL